MPKQKHGSASNATLGHGGAGHGLPPAPADGHDTPSDGPRGPAGGGHGPAGHGLHGLGDAFSFTITEGVVTAAQVTVPSGKVVSLPMTAGVAYSVEGADVLATRSGPLTNEVTRYSDTDADGLYEVVASSRVFTSAPQVNTLGFASREALAVTLTSGVVTGVSETRWDGTSKVLLSADVVPTDITWAITSGLLVETHTPTDALARYEVFQDGNADGVYTEVASGVGAMVDLVGVLAQTASFASLL